ncbi:ABC transporter type 1, transmembrane domain-containing protein [Paraphysoderma sedebokerense]|nr:ABC transporter type 1, transmembrane domain-containing protein [Paraphysoderma sedebokerense]
MNIAQPINDSNYQSEQTNGLKDDKKVNTEVEDEIEEDRQTKPLPPLRENSGFLSTLFFEFVTPLVVKGNKKLLNEDDVNDVESTDKSAYLCDLLQEAWKNELRNNPQNPSLAKTLMRVFKKQLILLGFVAVFDGIIRLGTAFALGYVIRFFRDVGKGEAQIWTGYVYAMVLVVLTFFHALEHHQYFWRSNIVGYQIRIGLVSMIYRHLLLLPISSLNSAGIVINLVSNDASTFETSLPFLHWLWLGPIHSIACVIILYFIIGWPCFVGCAVFGIFLPLQSWFGKLFGTYRSKTVKWRDERMKFVSDVIVGIQLVKFATWEKPFSDKILELRKHELSALIVSASMRAFNEAALFIFPVSISFFTFFTAWAAGIELQSDQVFTTLSIFHLLRITMSIRFPKSLEGLSEGLVSLHRIQEFLLLPTLKTIKSSPENITQLSNNSVVEMRNASFVYPKAEEFGNGKTRRRLKKSTATENQPPIELSPSDPVLKDLTVSIPEGALVGVIGAVGAGKSSFCSAILGELDLTSGVCSVNLHGSSSDRNQDGHVGYVTQTSWIIAGTVRDNVVFGSAWDAEWFWKVMKMTELKKDIEGWPLRENTIVGERGVTLSGGQRARLSLSRAIYSKPSVFVFDDPLSALDPKVGKLIFNSIKTGLSTSTRILVTHQLQFIRSCDVILVFDGGRIVASGKFDDIIASGVSFAQVLKEYGERKEESVAVDETIVVDEVGGVTELQKIEMADSPVTAQQNSPGREQVAEAREIGHVRWRTYHDFLMKTVSPFVLLLVLVLMTAGQVAIVFTDFWLAQWTNKGGEFQQNDDFYPKVYAVLTSCTVVFGVVRALLFCYVLLQASGKLSKKMLFSVLRSPMSFFQSNPHGRILNRFSKDQSQIDELLPPTMLNFIQVSFLILGILVVVCIIFPFVAISIPILAVFFVYLRRVYMRCQRQIKRIEATTRSPIYSYLGETIEGLATVRAFKAESRFIDHFMKIQDENTRALFAFQSLGAWLGLRLDLLAVSFLTVASLVSISVSRQVEAGLAGLAFSYTLQLLNMMQWAIRQSIEVEIMFIAVERMLEYSRLPSEAPEHTDYPIPPNWPSAGEIVFHNVGLTYPFTNAPVLKNVSLKVNPGEKIGIVGRTGSGKSSLLLTLFRLFEPTGEILIDGVDTKKLGLKDLRSKMSIIPVRVLFCLRLRACLFQAVCVVTLHGTDTLFSKNLFSFVVRYGLMSIPSMLFPTRRYGRHSKLWS